MNPLLLDIAEQFETERLILRVPRAGMGTITNEAICESLEQLRPWMPWAQTAPSVEETETFVRGAYVKYLERTELPLQLFLKDGSTLVGGSGLHHINWELRRFEIGYWCRTCFAGKGYIAEAVRGITRWGFETLEARRMQIRCDSRNLRSRRVAERCGYRLEGELRHDSFAVDSQELRNTLIFGMLRDEYFGQHMNQSTLAE
jgi:RimJ/RimL family protein N-acetyltransferase